MKQNVVGNTGDNENNRLTISYYLRECRSTTIKNEDSLQCLLRKNHENVEMIKIDQNAANEAIFWICDMIKSECLLMFIFN